jgi:putative transcriptional regulator
MNMAKRDLFNELMEGFDALKAERGGKITLRTTEIEMPKPIKMGANQIIKIRKAHNYSQAVFARMLATKVSTLRNWEQGRSEPNAQAILSRVMSSEAMRIGTYDVSPKAIYQILCHISMIRVITYVIT